MHKFFVESHQVDDEYIEILGQDVKHIGNVLRLRPEEKIEICCEGINYYCEIKDILKDKIITKILSKKPGESEAPIEIVLYQGLAKGNKMDLILQKGTEIGIKEFYVVSTDRSIVKINDKKKENSRIERLQAITEEAAKQSKRDYIPKVNGILSFKEMLGMISKEDNIIVPYEDENHRSIGHVLKNINGKKIHLIIGPEGGFETEEIQSLKEIGANIVTLGPRILRTETAGLVASTIILYELGDLGVI